MTDTAAIGGTAFDVLMAAEGLTSPSEAVAYLRGRGEIALASAGAERGYDGSDRR